jgi:hypothetical protein
MGGDGEVPSIERRSRERPTYAVEAVHPSYGWVISRRGRLAQPDNAGFLCIFGQDGKKPQGGECFLPIRPDGGLVFFSWTAIIGVTYSPCLSRSAVTHIKGEFFCWAPPHLFQVESR